MKYRLYVDESGTADYPHGFGAEAGKRYLSLTGVAISEQECHDVLCPTLDEMKFLLTGDRDEKFSLHRDEIKNRSGVYKKLADPEIEKKWNAMMEELIKNTDYRLFCVVIDKAWHKIQYTAPQHPYYYCMDVLIERYTKFLDIHNCKGDIMFESRGNKEDDELRKQYDRLYCNGSQYVSAQKIQQHLTSKDIKLKNKTQMISGLEFADLLALATKLDTLMLYDKIDDIASKFMRELVEWIGPKYYGNGKKGYGRKML